MGVVNDLVSNAHADIDLLRLRDSQGDIFANSRPVDFVFIASEQAKAAAVAGFLSDYQYAATRTIESDGEFRVVATVSMTIEQQAILSVSGFMQCIGALFGVTYDGWGAAIVGG